MLSWKQEQITYSDYFISSRTTTYWINENITSDISGVGIGASGATLDAPLFSRAQVFLYLKSKEIVTTILNGIICLLVIVV